MAETTSKTTKNDDKPAKTDSWSTRQVPHSWLYGLGGLLILLIVFAAGMGVAHHRTLARQNNIMVGSGLARGFGTRQRGMMFGGGQQVNTDNQSRLNGVVTSVNGNSFTLAGGGTTNTVTTSSSTQYQGGSQVKQNDTVVVLGAISNGSFNATQVVINP